MIWNVGDYREIGLKMVKGECSVIVLCGLVCDSVLGIRCFVEVGRLGGVSLQERVLSGAAFWVRGLGGEVAVLLQEHVFSGAAAFWVGGLGGAVAVWLQQHVFSGVAFWVGAGGGGGCGLVSVLPIGGWYGAEM